MKDGVRILNFARGGLVNSADVVAAIEAGKVAAYVTDSPPTICWASTASSRSPIWAPLLPNLRTTAPGWQPTS